MHYGNVAQNRERIYIIGFLNDEKGSKDSAKFKLFEELDKYRKNKTAEDRQKDIKKIPKTI